MSDILKPPKPMFNISGHSHGPESSVFGKSDIKRELAALMDDREKIEPHELMVSFFVVSEGSVSDAKIKPGVGRRSFDAGLVMAGVDIGLTIEDLKLPADEFRVLFACHVLGGFDHLVPYLKKKGLDFDYEFHREQLGEVLDEFLALTGEASVSWRVHRMKRFLKMRHPGAYEEITGEKQPVFSDEKSVEKKPGRSRKAIY